MAQQTYVFRIKNHDGCTIGNIVKSGTSQQDAERKLRDQYRNCVVTDVQVR